MSWQRSPGNFHLLFVFHVCALQIWDAIHPYTWWGDIFFSPIRIAFCLRFRSQILIENTFLVNLTNLNLSQRKHFSIFLVTKIFSMRFCLPLASCLWGLLSTPHCISLHRYTGSGYVIQFIYNIFFSRNFHILPNPIRFEWRRANVLGVTVTMWMYDVLACLRILKRTSQTIQTVSFRSLATHFAFRMPRKGCNRDIIVDHER